MQKYNILLICDEVAVGFGRTGTMFACEQEDVVPDIMCMGKGITGGYMPLAATIMNEQIFQSFLGNGKNIKPSIMVTPIQEISLPVPWP